MNYISTRNNQKNFTFKDVFLKGLADDGGLFVPQLIKPFKKEELDNFLKDVIEKDVTEKNKNPDKSKEEAEYIKDVIKELANKDKIEIKEFTRFKVGEGL